MAISGLWLFATLTKFSFRTPSSGASHDAFIDTVTESELSEVRNNIKINPLNGQDFDNEDIESRVQAEREANEALEKSVNDDVEAEEDVKTEEDDEPADDDVGQLVDEPETRESSAPPAKQPAHAKHQAEKVVECVKLRPETERLRLSVRAKIFLS